MKTILFASLGVSLLLSNVQCSTVKLSDNEKILYIAPYKKDCVGVVKMKCLQVKENKNDNWQNFYQSISGFNYKDGYEYELVVKTEKIENPPADASNIKYTLVKEISAVKK